MKARKAIRLLVLALGILALCNVALAGGVRSVTAGPSAMESINLSMGKSTVLRFKDKPKKIVIGNQNYFGIEFIENDIAIQPHGQIKTNMFVYTESRTYGFYLKVGSVNHDDLVKIEWDSTNRQRSTLNFRSAMVSRRKEIRGIEVKLKNGLIVRPAHIQYLPEMKLNALDLFVQNVTKNKLDIADLKLLVVRNGLTLDRQMIVKEKSQIESKSGAKVRVFFSSILKQDIKVLISLPNENQSFSLKKEFL
tara:strand:- start:15669 stop:16418 length:750 start_codon:yes stop_codon:yes gene_type:complete